MLAGTGRSSGTKNLSQSRRQAAGENSPSRFYAGKLSILGNSCEKIQPLSAERQPVWDRARGCIRIGQIHHEREHVAGIKTAVHAHELAKTLKRQTGSNQNKSASATSATTNHERIPLRPLVSTCVRLLSRCHSTAVRGTLKGRQQTKKKPVSTDTTKVKNMTQPSSLTCCTRGKGLWSAEQAQRQIRKPQSQSAPQQRKQNAFCKKSAEPAGGVPRPWRCESQFLSAVPRSAPASGLPGSHRQSEEQNSRHKAVASAEAAHRHPLVAQGPRPRQCLCFPGTAAP